MLTFRFLIRGTPPTPPQVNLKAAYAILRTAPCAITLAFITLGIPSAHAAPTAPNSIAGPRSHALASFDHPDALSACFIERGASQFTSISRDGLVWSPTATNLCTLILASQGTPLIPTDKTLATAFRLPTNGASFGIHLHGKSESAPSHLVLVSRTTADRGLIRVYRTPIWPSGTIAAKDQLPSAQIRVPSFPASDWYRLVITTQTNLSTAETTLAIQLLADTDGTRLASLDALDPGPALPGDGLVALRLFAPALGRVDVRSLIGQP
ncbi:MAG: hypothetical protein WC205_17530 [Opitutaceae bacterium]|jgi:hypothetical protein